MRVRDKAWTGAFAMLLTAIFLLAFLMAATGAAQTTETTLWEQFCDGRVEIEPLDGSSVTVRCVGADDATSTPTPTSEASLTPTETLAPTSTDTPEPTFTDEPTATSTSSTATYSCNLVIGYSQVGRRNGGWYAGGGYHFETIVPDDQWELKWANGAAVNRWADPDDTVWDAEIRSPCVTDSQTPDRILFSISGSYADNVDRWETEINAALATIRSYFPSAQMVEMLAVVGGPNHETCYIDGNAVRASWQHAYIEQAIERVASYDAEAVEGFSPEVRTCADYSDSVGHLTTQAGPAIGEVIGTYYE